MEAKINLIGREFGRLKVLAEVDPTSERHTQYACLCQCGNLKAVRTYDLLKGKVISCGCAKWLHGLSKSPEYRSWYSMKERCLNKKHPWYKYYGGRGITICKRWMSFENFIADMGSRPPGHTLDRIDCNKSYYPENCRWATVAQQNSNRRNWKAADIDVEF